MTLPNKLSTRNFLQAILTTALFILFLTACASPPQSKVSTPEAKETPTKTAPPIQEDLRVSKTIYPKALEGYIANPYMGWQDTVPFNKRFTETVAYARYNWKELHPTPQSYDWSPIEKLRTRGESISFRVRTARPPPWGKGQVMPDWVVKKGVPIIEGHSDIKGEPGTEPLYASCLFLEAHGKFVDTMRQKYDGDPDVAFIDIGSYGTYGEWDSEQYDDTPDSLDWYARRRIIDMYLGGQATRPCLDNNNEMIDVTYSYPGFQKTQLIMPYTPGFQDSVFYARNQRNNVGIRHDALGSERHQNAYQKQISALVEKTWPQAPIVFEFSNDAYTPEALNSAKEFAKKMHTSLIHDNFNGKGDAGLIEETLSVIGYRLVLKEITYTSELEPGQTLSFDMVWENTGVAPPYFKTYPLHVLLTDKQGRVVLNESLEPDIRTWFPGKPVKLAGETEALPNIPAGLYNLHLAFIEPTTQKPVLKLAIAGQDEQGFYLVGPVKISP